MNIWICFIQLKSYIYKHTNVHCVQQWVFWLCGYLQYNYLVSCINYDTFLPYYCKLLMLWYDYVQMSLKYNIIKHRYNDTVVENIHVLTMPSFFNYYHHRLCFSTRSLRIISFCLRVGSRTKTTTTARRASKWCIPFPCCWRRGNIIRDSLLLKKNWFGWRLLLPWLIVFCGRPWLLVHSLP